MSEDTQDKVQQLQKMIDNLESQLASMKQLYAEVSGRQPNQSPNSMQPMLNGKKPLNGVSVSNGGKIIEGVFDGEAMLGPDGRHYPVPPNYASKSKLVGGDILKLTITDNGSFIYKQIGPVERVQIIGTLKRLGTEYYVATVQGDYRVLTASVTYFKSEPGDQVTIHVPAVGTGGWGAIENIIPKIVKVSQLSESGPMRSKGEADDFEIPKTLFKRT